MISAGFTVKGNLEDGNLIAVCVEERIDKLATGLREMPVHDRSRTRTEIQKLVEIYEQLTGQRKTV